MSLRVALRIFDERAMRHLSSIVSLASQRAAPIKLVSASDRGQNAPEVIVVCQDEPGAHLLLKSSSNPRSPRVVIYGDCSSAHPWVLPSPATTENLQRLLEQIESTPISSLTPQACKVAEAKALSPIEPQPLLQAIAAARAERQILEVFVDEMAALLYVDGVNDCVYATHNFDFFSAQSYISLLQIPAARWRGLSQLPRNASDLNQYSIEAVIWQLAFAQPLSRVDDSLLQRTQCQLQRWPYFSQFSYSAEQLVWSAILMRKTTDLATLAKTTQTSPKTVCAFYNACVYAGITELSFHVAQAASRPSTGKRLLNALLKRLRGS